MSRCHPLLLVLLSLAALPHGAAAQAPAVAFEEVAQAVGVDFVHFNGMSGELFFVENMGAGAALLDYDGDGDLDLYLIQGAALGGVDPARATFPPDARGLPLRDRLYRNDLTVGTDGGPVPRFVDVTETSGLRATGYGMGVAVGDYDGDGWPDLYVTNFGPNQLWRNRGDGTFEDATARAGVDDPRWSVPAAFLDLEGDGDLDLFVGNYVDFSTSTHNPCLNNAGIEIYCGPLSFDPLPDRLFRNRGDGTFEDLSLPSGVGRLPGAALGVLAGDFDDDGRRDLFVANDQMANRLWVNRGNGTFEDEALFAGCAVNGDGEAEASMGIARGDVDGDGDLDFLLTHLSQETHTLYRNEGGGLYGDASRASGVGPASWAATGFGADFLDYDLDGHLDLLVTNGAVRQIETQLQAGETYALRQSDQLFRGLGSGRFEEVSAEMGGSAFADLGVGRGAAFGDLDLDGDTDAVLTRNSGATRILLARAGDGRPWLGLDLRHGGGDAALGATANLDGAAPWVGHAEVRRDGSYASAHDARLRFGLDSLSPEKRDGLVLRLAWPSGTRREIHGAPLSRYLRLAEGTDE